MKRKLTFVQKKGPAILNEEQKFPNTGSKCLTMTAATCCRANLNRATSHGSRAEAGVLSPAQFQPGSNGSAFSYLFISCLVAI